MARIIVEIDDSRTAILKRKAKRFGLLPDQFIAASIEDLISRPEPDFDKAMRKVLKKIKNFISDLRNALSFFP